MSRLIRCGFLCVLFLVMALPALAGNLLEPELLEMTEEWLTSDPQPGADYHVFRVCRDEEMTLDCTQGIYRAKENGAVRIPSNNRCIFRVQPDTYYNLFYQIQAASIDGVRSGWTKPRKILVYREIINLGSQSYSYSVINYETGEPLQQP